MQLRNSNTPEASLEFKISLEYVARPYLKTLLFFLNTFLSLAVLFHCLSKDLSKNRFKEANRHSLQPAKSDCVPKPVLCKYVPCLGKWTWFPLYYTGLSGCKTYEQKDTGEFTEAPFVCVQPGRERVPCPKWAIPGVELLSTRASVACPWPSLHRSSASWRCIWSTTVAIRILFVCLFPAAFLACCHTCKDPSFRAICLVTKNKKRASHMLNARVPPAVSPLALWCHFCLLKSLPSPHPRGFWDSFASQFPGLDCFTNEAWVALGTSALP